MIYESPQICLFDIDTSIVDSLKKASYNCNTASLGCLVRVPNKQRGQQHFLRLNGSWPENLHEYNILVFNMDFYEVVDFKSNSDLFDDVTGKSIRVLLSQFPEQIFNPRALSTYFLRSKVTNILEKESIVIIFAREAEEITYQPVEIAPSSTTLKDEIKASTIHFYNNFPSYINKSGQKMKSPDKPYLLTHLLLNYSKDSKYHITFTHPKILIGHQSTEDPSFFPLLLNNDGEIVSFCQFKPPNGWVFVFPCIKDKSSFLAELFKSYLPEIHPTLFPFHGQFGWLDKGDYLLPGEANLIEARESIENRYRKEVEENEKAISSLKTEFSFLHNLLSKSGDELVLAVEYYLKWLGFPNVVNMDETNPDTLEEDIQVDCGDKFLVIEVKGIGGTSTDKACSQISKIKYRRAEERGKFDVFGLYVVNHQRYTPPIMRNNPPFTEHQITDARLDKRGLITTYELYKAYFMVESGVLSKAEIRDVLFNYGLVELKPQNLISLGTPEEYYKSNTVVILNLENIPLKKGMDLLVSKNGVFETIQIMSLQVNDKEAEEAENGAIGVRLSKAVKKNSEFFVKKA